MQNRLPDVDQQTITGHHQGNCLSNVHGTCQNETPNSCRGSRFSSWWPIGSCMVLRMEVEQHSVGDLFPDPRAAFSVGDWMPPIIPLSPARRAALSNCSSPGVLELLVPGRVTASASIPQGSMTVNIEPFQLLGKIDVQQISAGITFFGTLDLDKKSKSVWNPDVHWVRAVKLSDDCHTYNVQLKFQPSYRIYQNSRARPQPKLVLQAVKAIEPGQELQLWFSEDILAMLQVVFLNPSNIQGENKYTCLRCSALYESPNPLKLHITLACGKLPISALWERLASLMRDPQFVRNVVPKIKDFDFKLTASEPISKQRSALDLTVSAASFSSHPSKGIYRPYTECSAFRPFKKQSIEITGNTASTLNPRLGQDLPALWPVTFETDVVQLHRNLMHNQALNNAQTIYTDDARIESLVSSLGKAKQGHICLYCGKCYSRKYGLKIHIRTHTGYKPLRCKFCDRPFGDPSNLNKHVRLHAEGNTPYKCDLCGKILVRRRDLERHLKSRHMVDMHPGENLVPDSPASTSSGVVPVLEDKVASIEETVSSFGDQSEEMSQVDEEDVRIIDCDKGDAFGAVELS